MDNSTDVQENYLLTAVIPLVFSAVFGLGVIGNFFVIYVIVKSKELLRSPTERYILNLAISDFLFVCTLPLWAATQCAKIVHRGVNNLRIKMIIKFYFKRVPNF